MKKRLFTGLVLACMSILPTMAQWGRPVDYSAGPGLKDAYKNYFTIGVAVNKHNISDPAQIEIIKKQFNSVVQQRHRRERLETRRDSSERGCMELRLSRQHRQLLP